MKKHVALTVAAVGLLSVLVLVPIRQAADAGDNKTGSSHRSVGALRRLM